MQIYLHSLSLKIRHTVLCTFATHCGPCKTTRNSSADGWRYFEMHYYCSSIAVIRIRMTIFLSARFIMQRRKVWIVAVLESCRLGFCRMKGKKQLEKDSHLYARSRSITETSRIRSPLLIGSIVFCGDRWRVRGLWIVGSWFEGILMPDSPEIGPWSNWICQAYAWA